jgi:hypothetical protein
MVVLFVLLGAEGKTHSNIIGVKVKGERLDFPFLSFFPYCFAT